ncbi:hypothetical protein FHY52_01845 [Nocardia nova]|uniref:hypothetical protein n=1 Tax=Nocardia nova TaxID=37330 RepID=UPI0025B114CF|nr:hypothetical protein [Nocardia nova]MDN2495459.1 hypothetical protein [Nocardia nova]
METISAHGVPDPPALVSHAGPAVLLVVFGVPAAAALVYGAIIAVRRRDPLPVAACLGALLCALNEPIFDVLGKIVYAQNHPVAFTAMGRSTPWFLVIGYVPWVGLLPYVIARGMATGWSRTRLYLIAASGVASVVGVELINLWLRAWEYYGEAPLKYFGGVAAMAAVPLAGGYLIYAMADHLRGVSRAVAGFLIPTMVLPMIFAATGWPLYIALYSNVGGLGDWLAIAMLCVLTVAAVIATTEMAHRTGAAESTRLNAPTAGRTSEDAILPAP